MNTGESIPILGTPWYIESSLNQNFSKDKDGYWVKSPSERIYYEQFFHELVFRIKASTNTKNEEEFGYFYDRKRDKWHRDPSYRMSSEFCSLFLVNFPEEIEPSEMHTRIFMQDKAFPLESWFHASD